MDANGRVRYLRKKMREKLKQWIPDNDFLVEKELKIFDRIMNRREFMQTTSAVAASALLYGCSDRHDIDQPPSAFDDTTLSDAERTSVKKASKITIDSDVLDSYGKYNPLAPKGSSDNSKTKDNAVMESFNPHIMTQKSAQDSQMTNLKPLDRNYGISELVHLDKESSTKNYKLSIFEKDFHTGQQALKESSIELKNTASLNFNKLIAANGNYHNRVKNGIAYSQKMLLISNINDTTNPDMRLYYQVASSPLLKAGVEAPKNSEWKYLDVINLFKTNEKDYSFKNYSIMDIDSYEDGSNNNFIYGTIQFDDFYNYGFVVTFSKIDATEPTVSFFTPKYLSKESNVIGKLKTDFDNLDIDKDVTLEEFSLFSSQKFIPFAQVDSEVLFSFVSIDTASDYYEGEVYPDEYGSYDLSNFADTSAAMVKRYLISVDSSKGGVAYLLDSYTMNASIDVTDDVFTLNFNTSTIPTIDIWSIFKTEGVPNAMATVQFKDSFVRYVKDEANELHIMLSSSILSESDIGVIHKSIKINYSDANGIKENFVLGENLESKSFMDASSFDGHEYKTMWFEDMKNSSKYNSLSDCANGDYGYYEFYSAHNHQGLLRSYFVIKVGDTTILLNFNEQGINPEPTSDTAYNYQDHDSLYENIKSGSVAHFPPLPISADVKNLLKWRSVGQDEEVIFSAMRPSSINSTTNTLEANSDSTLHSYFHSNLDAIDGGWYTHEIEKYIPNDTSKNDIYKVSRHQVHLHVNNIYNAPAELEKRVYVEVKFGSSVIVTDHTDTANPKTYYARRDTSLFFQPAAGLITLEVKSGSSHDDIFNGAIMMYRFADMSDFELKSNQPIATLTSAPQETTEFMQCNISFRQLERLTTKNVNSYQAGMRADELSNPQTAYDILHKYVKESQKDNIGKVTDLYQKIYENARPKNESALVAVGVRALESRCCHSLHKWVHKAVSTIKHSVKNVEKELVKETKKALEKLVDDIDTLEKDVSHSMHTLLTSLMVVINKIVTLANELILDLKEFWRFVHGFIGVDTAWKIGQELYQLEKDQLSPDSTVEGNVYSIIKEQTESLEKNVGNIATTFKNNIDNSIDASLSTSQDSIDTHLESAKSTQYYQQQNSTKHYHLIHQAGRLHHQMNLGDPQDEDKVDDSAFVCDASDTVEQLLKCISTKEVNTISNDIKTKLKNSEKIFHDLIYGKGMSAVKEDLTKLLKDSTNDMAKVVATAGEGVLQIPLAFLNGSSSITLAEEALDDVFKEVFEVLGFILFDDKDKFKTVQDVGYFFAGFEIYMTLSLYEEIVPLIDEKPLDIVSYIKSGDLRNEVNGNTLKTSSRSLNNPIITIKSFITMQVIDAILSVTIPAFNWLGKRGGKFMFTLLRIIINPLLIGTRMYAQTLVFKKHVDAEQNIYLTTAIFGDFLHFTNLILQLFQQFTYKYRYIITGSDLSIYNFPTVLHMVLFFLESLIHLVASVLIPEDYFGASTQAKKENQIEKKLSSLLGSLFSGAGDLLSGNSEEENDMSGVVVLNATAFVGTILFGAVNFGLSAHYLYETHKASNE